MHILSATQHARVSDYSKTARTKRKWFAQPPTHTLSLSLSPSFLFSVPPSCTCTYTHTSTHDCAPKARVYYMHGRGRSSLSRSIWPIRVPCTLLVTMRSTWHFRPDEESVEPPLYEARAPRQHGETRIERQRERGLLLPYKRPVGELKQNYRFR